MQTEIATEVISLRDNSLNPTIINVKDCEDGYPSISCMEFYLSYVGGIFTLKLLRKI